MKKQLFSIAAALLLALPGVAIAQQSGEWIFPDPAQGSDQCFSMTFRNGRAFGFQAPTRSGGDQGVIAFFGPEEIKDTPGDIVINLGVRGKWAGDHVGGSEEQPGTAAFLWRFDSWSDVDSFPDSFHVTMRKGSVKIFDGDITGFRGALAKVKQCVAARG